MRLGRLTELGLVAVFSSVLTMAAVSGLQLVSADGGDAGTIYACAKSSGDIRVVAADETCRNNETPLSWPTSAGISGYELVVATTPVASKAYASATASCPSGKVAVGGGAEILNAITIGGQEFWKTNGPVIASGLATGWTAAYYPSGAPVGAELQVTAICIDAL